MFDKERLDKENEQFSSAILYVATAVYVGVCAMVFGALYAKLPSFGEAFLALMKDYGTILAGIPVLVAVVVAKQQLDAMRHQHKMNTKLSFRNTTQALEELKALYTMIIVRSNGIIDGTISNSSNYFSFHTLPSVKVLDSWAPYVSPFLMDIARTTFEQFEIAEKSLQLRIIGGQLRTLYEPPKTGAVLVVRTAEAELKKLSENWS